MKASFFPGDLHIEETPDGDNVVRIGDKEVIKTRSQNAAVKQYKKIREQMETQFPATPLTQEQRAEIFRQAVLDSMVGHNSTSGRKKKSTASGSRTFGG